jgi:exosortase
VTLSRRNILFGVYSLLLLVGHLDVLNALVRLSWQDPTASHVVLVPFITLALIYLRREDIFRSAAPFQPAGAAAMVLGLTISVIGRAAWVPGSQGDALSAITAGLVVSWNGGFLLLYGRQAFRAALFPLLFLVCMVPMPSMLLGTAIEFLKMGSAEIVAMLFAATGTPHLREDFVFTLPRVVIEIADECSGIRSSIALVLTSLLAGDMYLKSSWKKALLIGSALAIAILKNGIRIAGLSLLALYVDPSFLTGNLHNEGGYVFFLLGLLIGLPILVVLHRSDLRIPRGVERA